MKAYKIYEIAGFQQDLDPYNALDVGSHKIKREVALTVTTDALNMIFDYAYYEENVDEMPAYVQKINDILGDDFEFCEQLFHPSEENIMWQYIGDNANKRFTYDIGYSDSWFLVFSDIEFPELKNLTS